MPNYKGIKEHEQAINAYLIKQFYEGFPDNLESQRKIVMLFYDRVWGNQKKISVRAAKDIRVRRVAQDLWDRSSNLASILTEEQKTLLQHEAEFKRRRDDYHGERVGIKLDSQWYKDPEFRDAFLKIFNSQKYRNMQF